MRRKIYIYLLICSSILLNEQLHAQDLHFSQFFNTPLSTNPANTGFLPTSDYRLGAHYREQWASIPVPYKTMSIYGDFQVLQNLIPSGWFGLGGLILQDVAGSGNLRSTKAYASVAYHQMLGNTSLLSAGFNLGFASKRINTSNLRFGDMWDGKFFNGPTSEILVNNSVNYLDIQTGLNYALFPSENIYFHLGASVHHLNKPVESFFSATPNNDNIVKPRFIYFADAVIKPNEQVIISPGVYYTHQYKASEFVAGMHLNYNVSGNGQQQLILGAYMRPGDAVIPMVGYQWGNFRFSFTYDATTSSLKNFNNGMGATEMYMQYNGLYTLMYADRQSFCPVFKN
ncbi:MAG: hypothetical protein RL634_1075 [Bacteroidota bacterium]|jgi:type IX secretion system PorP/SprF family membrane protein